MRAAILSLAIIAIGTMFGVAWAVGESGALKSYERYTYATEDFDANISAKHPPLEGEMSEEKRKDWCYHIATTDFRVSEVIRSGMLSEKIKCEVYYALGVISKLVSGEEVLSDGQSESRSELTAA